VRHLQRRSVTARRSSRRLPAREARLSVLFAVLLVLVGGCTAGNDASGTTDPVPVSSPATPSVPANRYPVVAVTDGDTIRVSIDGVEEKIRLIGIDAPELHNPVECFGQQATERAASMLLGESVALQADDSQDDRDRYGRLLRYVLLPDGTNVNQALLRGGYAFEYTYDQPYRYRDEFLAGQAAAEADKAGLWAADTCGGRPAVTPDPVSSSPATTVSQQEVPPGCPIKGNVNAEGEKIYHRPGDASYPGTVITPSKGERFFCTVEEAIAAGWRAPRN
jgi:micrococcal nuclease